MLRLPGRRLVKTMGRQMTALLPAGIECAIRAAPTENSLLLEAIVRANAPVAGRYRFVIFKQSETGSSNSTQTGNFTLQNEPEKVLSTLILDRSAVGHYHSELSLHSDQGKFECTSP
jgi:hypothetical protein